MAEPLALTFAGLFAFLALASLAGWSLVRRHGATPTLRNLNERIRSWWIMVAILALAFALGRTATILLFALGSFWCLREFLSLTPPAAPTITPWRPRSTCSCRCSTGCSSTPGSASSSSPYRSTASCCCRRWRWPRARQRISSSASPRSNGR